MAGFKRTEEYYVARSHIVLPKSISWYVKKLLPKYERWINESAGPNGDKSLCAKNFLHSLIPWLVEVLIQDSIFFVNDFPNHELSNYIKEKIPGYERWAGTQRQWVRTQNASRDINNVERLNAGARGAFETISRRVDVITRDTQANTTKMDRVMERLGAIERNVQQMMATMQSFMQQQQRQQQAQPQQNRNQQQPQEIQQQPQQQQQQQQEEEKEEQVDQQAALYRK